MLPPARGFLIEKSTVQALPILQQINTSELKASHERLMQLCEMDPGRFAAAPSDPPSKYKKAATPLSKLLPSQLPFHFFQISLPLHIIAKMASAESDLVRCYNNGRALHANIGLKGTQKMCDNLIAGSKSVKRQASPPEGSRGRRSRCSIMKPC